MMHKTLQTGLVAVIAVFLSFGGVPGTAADLAGLPIALVCQSPETKMVGYLAYFKRDGSAVYRSLGRLAATVDANGLVETSVDRTEGDCAGKTIEELRAMGRTIEAVQ